MHSLLQGGGISVCRRRIGESLHRMFPFLPVGHFMAAEKSARLFRGDKTIHNVPEKPRYATVLSLLELAAAK